MSLLVRSARPSLRFLRSFSAFTLPALPYERNALEPHISAETIDFHYGKHHQTYVNNLNTFLEKGEIQETDLDALVMNAGGPHFNNAAQVWNHTFYWNSLSPSGGGAPTGPIKEAIEKDFGSFEKFKEEFTKAAVGHFGSGWAWLVKADGALKVVQTHDAGHPLRSGLGSPLLVCDVWEHAYYIDRRNARPQYVEAWWNLINWDFANENLSKC